jgi:transposase
MNYYGVDVSKDTLDIACDGRVVQIENKKSAIKSFIRKMPEGSMVAMEATNTYHIAIADACYAAGMQVYVVNPRITRHYREVMSLRGHNDRMDALTLSRFIKQEQKQLRQYVPKTPDQRRLHTLIRRRCKLVTVKVQVLQSLREVRELKAELNAVVERIEQVIAKIELMIEKLLDGNKDRERIKTIKSVGPVVSAALFSDLNTGEFQSADSFVAYYGLDPRPNDSGRVRGRRKISKQGQRLGRTLLYAAAMSATKTKAWKHLYQRCLDKGLSKVQSLVVIARKIARTAWSIYTHKTTFDPARIASAAKSLA